MLLVPQDGPNMQSMCEHQLPPCSNKNQREEATRPRDLYPNGIKQQTTNTILYVSYTRIEIKSLIKKKRTKHLLSHSFGGAGIQRRSLLRLQPKCPARLQSSEGMTRVGGPVPRLTGGATAGSLSSLSPWVCVTWQQRSPE